MGRQYGRTQEQVEREAAERQAQIVEDVLWLDGGGVHPEWWPKSVGIGSLSALAKRMRPYPEIRRKIEGAITIAESRNVVR